MDITCQPGLGSDNDWSESVYFPKFLLVCSGCDITHLAQLSIYGSHLLFLVSFARAFQCPNFSKIFAISRSRSVDFSPIQFLLPSQLSETTLSFFSGSLNVWIMINYALICQVNCWVVISGGTILQQAYHAMSESKVVFDKSYIYNHNVFPSGILDLNTFHGF